MRTVVVSDIHLGAPRGRAQLARREVREALVQALQGTDRLVLLGDVLELREAPLRDALAAASRVLPELVAALATGAEVVIVPGNHDHHLLSGWIARESESGPPDPLELETPIDWMEREPLTALVEILEDAGATVAARYPGVWLRQDVYATHGHYLDVHTTVPVVERIAAGFMARMLHTPAAELTTTDEYEHLLAPLYAWIYTVAAQQPAAAPEAQAGISMKIWKAVQRDRGLRGRGAATLLSALTGTLTRLGGIGPLRADLSLPEMRYAELKAFGTVLAQLQIACGYAIFGHTHRAGPLPGDDLGEWIAPNRTRMMNTGCWVREADWVGDDHAHSPYRAGFAVELGAEGPPRLVNVLDA